MAGVKVGENNLKKPKYVGVRIRIPKPLFGKKKEIEEKKEKGKPAASSGVPVKKFSESRRAFLKRAPLVFGAAVLAGLGFKKFIDWKTREIEQTTFTPARSSKKPEFTHLEPSVTLVENALQNVLKNPTYNKIAFERTAWFYDFIAKHALEKKVDPSLLFALVAHESRGAVTAESRAGARGLAQFMPETGAEYGLYQLKQLVSSKKNLFREVGDERFDPDKSLAAAASHLRGLIDYYAQRNYLEEEQRQKLLNGIGRDPYAVFFALAAYNAGRANVDKAILKTLEEKGSPLSWHAIAKELPKETRDYVPFILAKKIILENFEHFANEHRLSVSEKAFGAYTRLLELTEQKKLWGTSTRSFAKSNKLNEKHLQLLNPHLKTGLWLKEALLRVPKKQELKKFQEEFKYFENLRWNEFKYSPRERKSEKKQAQERQAQTICEHVTHNEIKKSLVELLFSSIV